MSLTDKLARERRGRLAAERVLVLKRRELNAANRTLSDHALKLSDTIVELRELVATTRAQAEQLKSEVTLTRGAAQQARAHLAQAEQAATAAERRLWDSVETVTDGFVVFDAADRLVAANSAWIGLFDGLEAVKPGLGYADMLRLMVEEGLVDPGADGAAAWLEAMQRRWGGEAIDDVTIRLWDGRHLRLHDRRSRNGDMVCLGIDITEAIRHERELRTARDAAEEATRAKSAFLAKMSHELRTPMNGVAGMADLLLETELDQDQALYVGTIRQSARTLLDLISDVLDFSRAEAERLTLFPQRFDLEEMLCEIVTLSLPVAREKGLELVLDYAMAAPSRVCADPKRLRQIIVNLLGNALKFTEAGHVRISVRATEPDGPGAAWGVRIALEDTGIGISPERQGYIFGHFNQVEDEKNRNFEGAGLGLAIARQLAELMGGAIEVRSREGEGTTFTLELPLEADAPRGFSGGWDARRRPRIIFATPSDIAARTIRARQEFAGVDLEIAPTPEALRDAVCTGPEPDAIVTDGAIGDGALVALVRELRARLPRTMLAHLLRQGQGTQSGRDALSEAGIDHIVSYPWRNFEIRSMLSQIARAPSDRAAAGGPGTAAGVARRMRVLAAEDNRTNRLVFSKMLKGLNLDLTFAENGEQAVALYQSLRPDVVFMDISMPGMDGKAATGAIRAIEAARGWGRVPVVAMTAHAMDGDDAAILAAGLDHYLTKPLKKQLIQQQIALHAPEGAAPLGSAAPARAAS